MGSISKVEVNAFMALFDVHTLIMSTMLQNQLLKKHKCSLVTDMLPYLHHTPLNFIFSWPHIPFMISFEDRRQGRSECSMYTV